MSMTLGIQLSLSGNSGAFNPLSLSPVAWYDPSDLFTLFSDSAATTAAVVNGPVGCMKDKSGLNRHMLQATAGARPILRQAGALYYLEFDGVDDLMDAAGIVATQPNVIYCANASTGFTAPVNISDGITTRQALVETSTGTLGMFAGLSVTTNTMITNNSVVFGATFNGVSSFGRANGVNSGSFDTSTNNLSGVRLGAFISGTAQWAGKLYGFLVTDDILTTRQTTDLDTYLGAKAGIIL